MLCVGCGANAFNVRINFASVSPPHPTLLSYLEIVLALAGEFIKMFAPRADGYVGDPRIGEGEGE